MNARFGGPAKYKAWDRQKSKCAGCGLELRMFIMEGRTLLVHPIIPFKEGGDKTASNCVILCMIPPNNCHLKIGHGGREDSEPCRISMSDLPYLNG